MLALVLVAASVGLGNFAASISLGVGGVDARTRLRVGLIFGVFEAGMPVVGLLIGQHVASHLGQDGRWVGGALLVAIGLYSLVSSLWGKRDEPEREPARHGAGEPGAPGAGAPPRHGIAAARLILSGLALSLDNLVAGFALGTYHVPILTGSLIMGAVSVGLSLAGLEVGARLGRWAVRRGWGEERGDQLGGVILISVGVAIAAGALS
jgi:putative Mn2+ efflux pump MntP